VCRRWHHGLLKRYPGDCAKDRNHNGNSRDGNRGRSASNKGNSGPMLPFCRLGFDVDNDSVFLSETVCGSCEAAIGFLRNCSRSA